MKYVKHFSLLIFCIGTGLASATSERERFDAMRGNFSCEQGEPLSNWHEFTPGNLLDLSFREMEDNNLFVVIRFVNARKLDLRLGSEVYSFTQQTYQFDCERARVKRLELNDKFSAYIGYRLSGRRARSDINCTRYAGSTQYTLRADEASWIDFKKVSSINLKSLIEKVCR
jgi:hypothetical protein